MKKINTLLVLSMLTSCVFSFSAFAKAKDAESTDFRQFNVTISVNDREIEFDSKPFIHSDYDLTYVPIRFVVEALHRAVEWNEENRQVTIKNGDETIKMRIGDKQAYVGSKEQPLDGPVLQIEDRTMVPLRFVSEALRARVDYEEKNSRAYVNISMKEGKPDSSEGAGSYLSAWKPGSNSKLARALFPNISISSDTVELKVPEISGQKVYAFHASDNLGNTPEELKVGRTYTFDLGERNGQIGIMAKPDGKSEVTESYSLVLDKNHVALGGKYKNEKSKVIVIDAYQQVYTSVDRIQTALDE